MKILLTGANGYIGKRLLPVLIDKGYEVYCFVRNKNRFTAPDYIKERIKIFEVDIEMPIEVWNVPTDFDVAFYLVHSMSAGHNKFGMLEEISAKNFVNYINQTSAKQIIYLGGIHNDTNLSKHLASRFNVEQILSKSTVPITVLRAGIIVGSGSASFEIIRDLVEKLPIMITPRWMRTRTHPIAIRNVIDYLSKVMLNEQCLNKTFDIGGPEILTYKTMLLRFAEVRGYKRYIYDFPFIGNHLSAYWLYFLTSTSFNLAKNLVESLRNEIVADNSEIQKIIPLELIDYKTAVQLAFDKIRQNMVLSTWKDALSSGKLQDNFGNYIEVPEHGCFIDKREKVFTRNADDILANIWAIGGKRGWYSSMFLWQIRGFIDRLLGGVGLQRGRRSSDELNPGDPLDFWRVLLADREKGRLLLYAEMRLPGDAWLEFKIVKQDGKNKLIQTATFRPNGLAGRLYWYSVKPFHFFIFNGMINNIINFYQKGF